MINLVYSATLPIWTQLHHFLSRGLPTKRIHLIVTRHCKYIVSLSIWRLMVFALGNKVSTSTLTRPIVGEELTVTLLSRQLWRLFVYEICEGMTLVYHQRSCIYTGDAWQDVMIHASGELLERKCWTGKCLMIHDLQSRKAYAWNSEVRPPREEGLGSDWDWGRFRQKMTEQIRVRQLDWKLKTNLKCDCLISRCPGATLDLTTW
jgi:hypothetical protein